MLTFFWKQECCRYPDPETDSGAVLYRSRIVKICAQSQGYDIQTKRGFLVPVPRRDARTLLPIIVDWVEQGTTIWSDQWAAYNRLGQQGFIHGTVNHTLNFVDPATGVTTNRVEAMWQRAKAKFKAMFGPSNRDIIPNYLAEFMWMQRFREHAFYHFWQQIATELYVVWFFLLNCTLFDYTHA